MSPRGDDPLYTADGPDDDRRDTRRSESTGRGEDHDRAEQLPEQGDERDAGEPDTWAETRDRAEEQAATADASLRERMQAGVHRAGEVAAGSAGVLLVSLTSFFTTDDKLPEAARIATAASDVVEEVASDTRKRKEHEGEAEEPDQGDDGQEQLPPGREGDRPAADRAAGPADGVDVDSSGRGG
ncbi:hypothetical protein [Micromonospora halophytica]|uniref:Uncharacterized protein n=1 Tax=Micromonospora halophytica TaxID=47864 RepID=A0A1C5J834_9ACTN|nr:hypothetical protein [Micromonospora halophytica]SCG66431.1 hypothetical protein GA0070560_12349 [Micromonospora halophytica]